MWFLIPTFFLLHTGCKIWRPGQQSWMWVMFCKEEDEITWNWPVAPLDGWMDGLALWFIAYTCCVPAWGSFCSVLSNIFPGWSCNGKQISPPDLSSEKKQCFFFKTENKVSQQTTRCLIWEQNTGFRKERTRSQPKERVEPFFINYFVRTREDLWMLLDYQCPVWKVMVFSHHVEVFYFATVLLEIGEEEVTREQNLNILGWREWGVFLRGPRIVRFPNSHYTRGSVNLTTPLDGL